ncbi:MAG: hypothetical protein ACO1NS_02100 [Daejeonella sp.]
MRNKKPIQSITTVSSDSVAASAGNALIPTSLQSTSHLQVYPNFEPFKLKNGEKVIGLHPDGLYITECAIKYCNPDIYEDTYQCLIDSLSFYCWNYHSRHEKVWPVETLDEPMYFSHGRYAITKYGKWPKDNVIIAKSDVSIVQVRTIQLTSREVSNREYLSYYDYWVREVAIYTGKLEEDVVEYNLATEVTTGELELYADLLADKISNKRENYLG